MFVSAQFLIRDESLHLITYWRSQDMWGAAPANWYGLSQLMEYAAKRLGVNVGTFTSFSASTHIYKTDWKRVEDIIGAFPRNMKLQTPSFRKDTSGYFLIELNTEIIVEHRNTKNKLLYRISGTDSEGLSRKIAHLSPSLNPQHLIYLGRELKKAEIALTTEKEYYTQDKPLSL